MNQLMRQAQKMQQDLAQAQEEVAEMTAEVIGAGHQIQELEIKPEVVDPDDIEMLQDLIVAAVNDACRQLDEKAEERMSQVTGGNLSFPGF
jgi:DNA-binding YbaB/EbfC family protein